MVPGEEARTPEPESRVDPVSEILARLTGRAPSTERYRLEGEIARGGMGAILRVWDADLRRHLAMKVIVGEDGDEEATMASLDERLLGRFLEEAQVTGQLDHPGIVPVHELGLDSGGRVFFTMKLVKGEDLKQVFAKVQGSEEGWTQVRALGALLKVCEAMSYAHDKGVVHRDLKPANVMVGRFGEVFVMDWGLAKVIGQDDGRDLRPAELDLTMPVESARKAETEDDPDSPLVTMDGAVLGTPAYMSPEQALGQLEDMGAHSDVYSVGAMLYQLVAGHAPYVPHGVRMTSMGLLGLVQNGPPESLHTRAPSAPAELVSICEKAMARDTRQRYPDMSALGEDLRAFMEARVVRAHKTGAFAELRKWMQRNRGVALATASAVLAVLVGAGVIFGLWKESEKQRREVLHLSSLQNLAQLRERAARLWPVHPDRIPDYEAWLAESSDLLGELETLEGAGGHRAKLLSLRAEGHPTDPARLDELVRAHPEYERLVALEAELAARELAAAVRAGTATLQEPTIPARTAQLPPEVINDMAWDLVKPWRDVFGREAEGLALSRLVEELKGPGDDAAEFADTHAWACFACGLDEEAIHWAERALAESDEFSRLQYETKLAQIRSDVAAADGPQARERTEILRRTGASLREEIHNTYAWTFDDEETAWWHLQLMRLIRELDELADPVHGLMTGSSERWGWGIRRRLDVARRILDESIGGEAARAAWSRARAAIRDHPEYGGLELSPQVGLVPLGPDDHSGLWEFAHVLSGEVPARGHDGRLRLDAESAIVLVLVPPGEFFLGAQGTDPAGPNYDRMAREDEGPVRSVRLDAFFVSKYEMTQAQWQRFTSVNPSRYRVGSSTGGRPNLATNPVENVSWQEAQETLSRMGLALPTEAQWEYVARARTDTPWSWGAEREDLIGKVNLADGSASAAGNQWSTIDDWDGPDDQFSGPAPIGTFEPNPFGLHEALGNVAEWCSDGKGSYHLEVQAGDGERLNPVEPGMHATRGGSFTDAVLALRSSHRLPRAMTYRFSNLGIRPSRAVEP